MAHNFHGIFSSGITIIHKIVFPVYNTTERTVLVPGIFHLILQTSITAHIVSPSLSRPCNGFAAVLRRVRNCRVWLIDWLSIRGEGEPTSSASCDLDLWPLQPHCCDTVNSYHTMCLPGLVEICQDSKVTVDLYSASLQTHLWCATASHKLALISASQPVQPGASTTLWDHRYGLVYHAMYLFTPPAFAGYSVLEISRRTGFLWQVSLHTCLFGVWGWGGNNKAMHGNLC